MTFQGELTQEEVDLVIGVGLNWLLKEGALPMKVVEDSTSMVMEAPEDLQ